MVKRSRSSRRPQRRSRRPNPTVQGLRAVTQAVRNLTVVTQDGFLPTRPDHIPRPVPIRRPIHVIRRNLNRGVVTADNFGVGASLEFSLSDDPSASDMTNLFDQFRIVQVIVKFSSEGSSFGQATTITTFPTMLTCIDYNDNVAPANANAIRQYDTCMIFPYNKSFQRVIHPRMALGAYQGTFTAYAEMGNPFIDIVNAGVEYYGLKWFTTPVTVPSGSYTLYNIECEYTFEFRDTK